MALIIEDGTIVANANSYVTDAEFTDYADSRLIDYPLTPEAREPLIIKAMDYLETQSYAGNRTDGAEQLFSFPRVGVWANDRSIASDEVPREIKNAQIEAAFELSTQELLINSSVQNVQREKLDVLEVSYFKGGSSPKIRLDKVNRWLAPFLVDTNELVRT